MEFMMLTSWQQVLEVLADTPEHRVWHERVLRAEARLRQSGVLKNRGLENKEAVRLDTALQEDRARLVRERGGPLRVLPLAS